MRTPRTRQTCPVHGCEMLYCTTIYRGQDGIPGKQRKRQLFDVFKCAKCERKVNKLRRFS